VIAVIGTGPMGVALARALAAAGYRVRNAGVREVSLSAVLGEARTVIYALPRRVALDTAPALPDGDRRILVDVTNPAFDARPPQPSLGRSVGELLSERLPSWRVVKAFNTVPAGLVGSPRLCGVPVTVPVAGDEPLSRQSVCAMAARLGFDAVDAGGIIASRAIESLAALLWNVGNASGHRGRVGFRLLSDARPDRKVRAGDAQQ